MDTAAAPLPENQENQMSPLDYVHALGETQTDAQVNERRDDASIQETVTHVGEDPIGVQDTNVMMTTMVETTTKSVTVVPELRGNELKNTVDMGPRDKLHGDNIGVNVQVTVDTSIGVGTINTGDENRVEAVSVTSARGSTTGMTAHQNQNTDLDTSLQHEHAESRFDGVHGASNDTSTYDTVSVTVTPDVINQTRSDLHPASDTVPPSLIITEEDTFQGIRLSNVSDMTPMGSLAVLNVDHATTLMQDTDGRRVSIVTSKRFDHEWVEQNRRKSTTHMDTDDHNGDETRHQNDGGGDDINTIRRRSPTIHVLSHLTKAPSMLIPGLPPSGNSHVPKEHVYLQEDYDDMFLGGRPSAVIVASPETAQLLRELKNEKPPGGDDGANDNGDASGGGGDATGVRSARSRRGRADTRSPLANRIVVARKYTPCRKPRSYLNTAGYKKAPPLPPSPPEVHPPIPSSVITKIAPERLLRSLLRVHEVEPHSREELVTSIYARSSTPQRAARNSPATFGGGSNSGGIHTDKAPFSVSRESSLSALIPKEGPYYIHPWVQETPQFHTSTDTHECNHHHPTTHVHPPETLPAPVLQYPNGRRWLLENMDAGSAMSLAEFQRVLDNSDFTQLAHTLVPATRYVPGIDTDRYHGRDNPAFDVGDVDGVVNDNVQKVSIRRGRGRHDVVGGVAKPNMRETYNASRVAKSQQDTAQQQQEDTGRLTPAGFVGPLHLPRPWMPTTLRPSSAESRRSTVTNAVSVSIVGLSIDHASVAPVAKWHTNRMIRTPSQHAIATTKMMGTLHKRPSRTSIYRGKHRLATAITTTDQRDTASKPLKLGLFPTLSKNASLTSINDRVLAPSTATADTTHPTPPRPPQKIISTIAIEKHKNTAVYKPPVRLAVRLPALPIHVPSLPATHAGHRRTIPTFHEDRLIRVMHHEHPEIIVNTQQVPTPNRLAVMGQRSESPPDVTIIEAKPVNHPSRLIAYAVPTMPTMSSLSSLSKTSSSSSVFVSPRVSDAMTVVSKPIAPPPPQQHQHAIHLLSMPPSLPTLADKQNPAKQHHRYQLPMVPPTIVPPTIVPITTPYHPYYYHQNGSMRIQRHGKSPILTAFTGIPIHTDATTTKPASITSMSTTMMGHVSTIRRLVTPHMSIRGYDAEPDDKVTKITQSTTRAEKLHRVLKTTKYG